MTLERSHVRPRDVVGLALVGPRTRRLRSVLTAMGIAIGIAALVAVMGISQSSRADLIAQLDALGTNRLQVEPGQSFTGGTVTLPDSSAARIRRLDAIQQASAVTKVDATVRRSDVIPEAETGGISALAAEVDLLDAVGASVATGRWLDGAAAQLPTVVLGATAAERLGVEAADGREVQIGSERFAVIGILDPIPLYATLDAAAFVGYPVAADTFDTDPAPSTIYAVVEPEALDAVRGILAATANPESPGEVDVSNPSDALAAKEAVSDTLTALLLGLGGVALLVGGIGIANVMVIGVLERRTEIGVRRALGATRGHIRTQFLLEAVLLGSVGGALGVALGSAVTFGYARLQDMTLAIPPTAVGIGLGAALVIGALAGISPAARAARLEPAEAIRPV